MPSHSIRRPNQSRSIKPDAEDAFPPYRQYYDLFSLLRDVYEGLVQVLMTIYDALDMMHWRKSSQTPTPENTVQFSPAALRTLRFTKSAKSSRPAESIDEFEGIGVSNSPQNEWEE
jgi:hypothetical protein